MALRTSATISAEPYDAVDNTKANTYLTVLSLLRSCSFFLKYLPGTSCHLGAVYRRPSSSGLGSCSGIDMLVATGAPVRGQELTDLVGVIAPVHQSNV